MAKEKVEELSSVLVEIMETQKMLQKEMKYLKDDIKAQNRMIAETMKINRTHQETAVKQTEILDKISNKLDSTGMPRAFEDEAIAPAKETVGKPEDNGEKEPIMHGGPTESPEAEPRQETQTESVPEIESDARIESEQEPESTPKTEPFQRSDQKSEPPDTCKSCGKKLEPVYITCPYCGAVR